MSVLSMRSRRRAGYVVLTAFVGSLIWLLQANVLNGLYFLGAACNLPLTFVILWGSVAGSPLAPISREELRQGTVGEIFLRQVAGGSVSGALLGAFFGALYAAVLPVYPICFSVIGWISGYFCLRNLNRETLICIPLVLLATVAAESIMAAQLWLAGRADVFGHLAQIALPEALINSLVAPFIYFPLRRWYDFAASNS